MTATVYLSSINNGYFDVLHLFAVDIGGIIPGFV